MGKIWGLRFVMRPVRGISGEMYCLYLEPQIMLRVGGDSASQPTPVQEPPRGSCRDLADCARAGQPDTLSTALISNGGSQCIALDAAKSKVARSLSGIRTVVEPRLGLETKRDGPFPAPQVIAQHRPANRSGREPDEWGNRCDER
jgi:hypothetical protein